MAIPIAIQGITAIEFDIQNRSAVEVSFDDLNIDANNTSKIYWIHCSQTDQNTIKKINAKLHLPDDVIELCTHQDSMPKLIDADESITVQIQCLLTTELNKKHDINFSNLIIHLTPNFCFTSATEPLPVLSEFINSYQKALRFAKTPCFILFLLLDSIINDYARILFNFELVADKMDIHVRKSHKNIYKDVMAIKQKVMHVKHYTIAAREILVRISGRKISVVSEQCRSSLYNLSNHSHMVVHEADSIRDMLNSLLDQIDNTLMTKMSESMKILSAIAAIFLPLSLITGIYGMNFRWMPELEWKYGYFWALGLIFFCGIMMIIVFKRKRWF